MRSRIRVFHGLLMLGFGLACLVGFSVGLPCTTAAQESYDGWNIERAAGRTPVYRMSLSLTPQAAPRPWLRYALLPRENEQIQGNAAVFYLNAMGFLEQDPARKKLYGLDDEARQRAKEADVAEEAPWQKWLSTAPQDLPRDEVREYLQLTAFQSRLLQQARLRSGFDLERNLRDTDDVIGFLLPEVQVMRGLARTQSLRCRLAIAEGRLDDAIQVLGQQYAMGRHIAMDEFIVSGLVGAAIVGIASRDALYFIEHPDAPNLYWALAVAPKPLVDMRRSIAVEYDILLQQLKVLREVDETPRPAGFWQDALRRLAKQIGSLDYELGGVLRDASPEQRQAALIAAVIGAYPGAKRYLIETQGMAPEVVEAYPTAQVVLLAVVKYDRQARDRYFSAFYLPYWQAAGLFEAFEKSLRDDSDRYGLTTTLTNALLPAIRAVSGAAARTEQQLALIQTTEAIRMYGAEHDGRLPNRLAELPVPAPLDPVTGKEFQYELKGDTAVLTGGAVPGLQYQFELSFRK